ncbi:MAG: AbrB/MazE/SpoVT family DNA-binding domain-containing protein [Desulfobacterales bacterium]|nr:AbrB/MazE/SpoVT family DNA-binding domain-containing protein [Desulfobacterales bacterium]
MPTATLTTKGQAVIPKAIRDHLKISPGDRLDFVVMDDGEVVVRPATYDVRQLRGLLLRKGQKPVSLEEMAMAVRNRKGLLK